MTKIRSTLKHSLAMVSATYFTWLSFGSSVQAADVGVPDGLGNGVNAAKPPGAPDNLIEIFKNIINTIIFITGAIAVLMLIIGGVRYVTASGNPERVKGATNTILYAIIGIVIAIVAFAAVQFVINQLGGTGSQ